MRSAVIRGTRVQVRMVVGYWKEGHAVEDILDALPHLRPAQVHDALSYYHDHRSEIEREIRQSSIPRVLRKHGLKVGRGGRITKREAAG